jgi:hypothetical protein
MLVKEIRDLGHWAYSESPFRLGSPLNKAAAAVALITMLMKRNVVESVCSPGVFNKKLCSLLLPYPSVIKRG